MQASNIDYSTLSSDSLHNCFAECDRWEQGSGDCSWEVFGHQWVTRDPVKFQYDDGSTYSVYFIRELRNLQEDLGEPEFQTLLYAVSLDLLDQEKIDDVDSCFDWCDDVWLDQKLCDIASYGYAALLWSSEISTDELGYQNQFKELDDELDNALEDLESALDIPQNKLGHTGWHTIQGIY